MLKQLAKIGGLLCLVLALMGQSLASVRPHCIHPADPSSPMNHAMPMMSDMALMDHSSHSDLSAHASDTSSSSDCCNGGNCASFHCSSATPATSSSFMLSGLKRSSERLPFAGQRYLNSPLDTLYRPPVSA